MHRGLLIQYDSSSIKVIETLPTQITGMEGLLNERIRKLKLELHDVCEAIYISGNKIDMIQSRINSKVPIKEVRLKELEKELLKCKMLIDEMSIQRDALENKIKQLKIELNDEENTKY